LRGVPRSVLIVNPYASRVTDERTAAVARILGVDAVLRTERRGHATDLARAACETAGAVFVFSGDGGFNEALNGADGKTPLGFVPGGGTSVLPRALGLPRDPLEAAARLREAPARRISLGRVNGRRFGFSAGLGLDAELIRRVDALGRTATGRRAGDLAFVWAAVRVLAERRATFPPALELRVGDAPAGRAAFALVANCDPYTFAGPVALRIAPLARFELGLDVVAPRAVRPASLARFVTYLARGRGQERAADVLYRHDADRIEAVCDSPQPLQADGEDLGDVTEAVFEAERDAVAVLAPR
jgi:diacylglycerol kinase family enzyme